jgi:peptidoglycan/LPS O-acetylase OafA/YrhL
MHNNNFTIIRLILATLVVFGHFKVLPGLEHEAVGIYGYADFAVAAFFVVSGYLVYGSFVNSPEISLQKMSSFYVKRFFRIYPLYAFMILAQTVFMVWVLGDSVRFADVIKYLGSNLIFANFISPDIGRVLSGMHNNAINPSLWTLKIEVMFYLAVPFLWWLINRYGVKILMVTYVLSTIFAAVTLYYGHETLSKQLPGQLRFFVVGIAIYIFKDKFNLSSYKALTMAFIIFAICSFRDVLPVNSIYPLLLGMLVFICALRFPVMELKYDISYGVYLIHAPLIQAALLLGIYENNLVFLSLLLAAVFAAAFAAEKLIEIPMVRYGKKLSEIFSQKFARS